MTIALFIVVSSGFMYSHFLSAWELFRTGTFPCELNLDFFVN